MLRGRMRRPRFAAFGVCGDRSMSTMARLHGGRELMGQGVDGVEYRAPELDRIRKGIIEAGTRVVRMSVGREGECEHEN